MDPGRRIRDPFDDAARFFLGEAEARRQRRYRFEPVYARQGQRAVRELFRSKCAFCGTPDSGKRPSSGAGPPAPNEVHPRGEGPRLRSLGGGPKGVYPLGQERREIMARHLGEMGRLLDAWVDDDLRIAEEAPRPTPELQIRPRM